MRWFVEVATLSAGGPATRVTVEGPSWQAALAQARSGRADATPLANFTIEVLAEGYRATNPLTRVRYTVNKAPDDAPLAATTEAAPSSAPAPASGPPSSTPASIVAATMRRAARPSAASAPPASAPAAPVSAAPASAAPAPNAPSRASHERQTGNGASASSSTLAKQSVAGEAAPNTVAQARRPESAPPPRLSGHVSALPRPASVPPPAGGLSSTSSSSVMASSATSGMAPGIGSGMASVMMAPQTSPLLEGNAFLRRGEDPGGRSPLTYREIAIAVSSGTSLDRAVAIAHAHFDDVQRTLDAARAPAGRLVQIAIFDHEWKGRPERRPLVTLTAKDWKGKPTVSYPANFPSAAPAMKSAKPISDRPPSAAPSVSPSSIHAAAPTPSAATPPPAVAAALTPASSSTSRPRMDASSVAAEIALAVASSDAARVTAPKPPMPNESEVPKSVEAAVAATPSVVLAPGVATAPAAAPAAAPALGRTASGRFEPRNTPAPTSDRPRARPEDLMSEIFESMHDLHFLRDSLEGADFVLELLHQKLPSRVALIHLYDINSKEFVVVKARSPAGGVLGTRVREGQGLVGAAAVTGQGILVEDASKDARWSRERYQAAGHMPKSICVVPVRSGRRYLGAIELADHLDGRPFGEDVLHAMTYIAEQFAEFVADRGVTLNAGDSGAFTALDHKH